MKLTAPYTAYTYAYPHKMAYRPFSPQPLSDVWQNEPKNNLFLYIHIPFCDIRCGFCNLFTTTNPADSFTTQYLDALWREAEAVKAAIPEATIAQVAIGGGTPTYLETHELERVLRIAEDIFDVDLATVPVSVETSPQTATPERLALLRARGVDRISMGVQSFITQELNGIGRPQKSQTVQQAFENLTGFHTRNLDLIYGNPHQTVESWLESLEMALAIVPEQLYLYPLYVRPLTGMSKMSHSWDDQRLMLYRAGRAFLLAHGYEQKTMRLFQRKDHTPQHNATYTCQEDGMIGLGCGARSYTSTLHYSSEYAVGRVSVKDILHDWVGREFGSVAYGFALDADERMRRYLLKSLLSAEGLDCARFATLFGRDVLDAFPELADLTAYVGLENGRYSLTPTGLEWSDALGPLFYSPTVRARSEAFDLT